MIASAVDPRRLPASWRLPALAYVVAEAVLAAIAFSGPEARPGVEIAAFALALPAVVVALPLVYVAGALAWTLRDQLTGHPMWPVTVTFTLLFVLTAVANVLFLRLVREAMHRRRTEFYRSRVSPRLR